MKVYKHMRLSGLLIAQMVAIEEVKINSHTARTRLAQASGCFAVGVETNIRNPLRMKKVTLLARPSIDKY